MSTPALAALVWSSQSEEERARDRQLVAEFRATEFPPGFAEALERLQHLQPERRNCRS